MRSIKVQRPDGISSKQPILFEVTDSKLRLVLRDVLEGDSKLIRVDQDALLKVTLFPGSGVPWTSTVEPLKESDGPAIVQFSSQDRPDRVVLQNEFHATRTLHGARRSPFGQPANALSGNAITPEITHEVLEDQLRGVSTTEFPFRIWRLNQSTKTYHPVEDQRNSTLIKEVSPMSYGSGSSLELRLQVPIDGSYLIQYGHRLLGVQNSVLPPGMIRLEMRCLGTPQGQVDQIDLDVDLSNSLAENLVPLIHDGEIERAKSLASVVMTEKKTIDAELDPSAALVGGYFMLKTHDRAGLQWLLPHLIELAGHFPDSQIVLGWSLLQEPSIDSRFSRAQSAFQRAIEMGVPVFAEGLRMLVEGCRLLQAWGMDVANFAHIVRYFQTSSRRHPYVTFYGLDPNKPVSMSSVDEFNLFNEVVRRKFVD